MAIKKSLLYTLDTLEKPVTILYELLSTCSIITFQGTLGSGKTTLIQHLLQRCGVSEVVVSPTFTYMVSYTNQEGSIFYHFDLYRIKNLQEFLQAGFEEFLYSPKSWAFIEWPEVIFPLITKRACYVYLHYADTNKRLMEYTLSSDRA